MDLGAFSISLSVADIDASRLFYGALGFEPFDGDGTNWVMLRNGDAYIGLFHGMFEGNIITFNPPDARAVQAALDEAGVEIMQRAEPGDGPCHLTLADPDGNAILIDQHQG